MNILDVCYSALCDLADAFVKRLALAWLCCLLIHAADDKRAMLAVVVKIWRMNDADLLWLVRELDGDMDEIRRERERARRK